jgi:hypothetical protein
MQRSDGEQKILNELTGVIQTGGGDDTVDEVHGMYDKFLTALHRIPGKIVMTSSVADGPVWTVQQLRFRDRMYRFVHEGAVFAVESDPMLPPGLYDGPKLPGGPPYTPPPDWPQRIQRNGVVYGRGDTIPPGEVPWLEDWSEIEDRNEELNDQWQTRWDSQINLIVEPLTFSFSPAGVLEGNIRVRVEGTSDFVRLWFRWTTSWLSVGFRGLTPTGTPTPRENGRAGRYSGETNYYFQVAGSVSGLDPGTYLDQLRVSLLNDGYWGLTPTENDIMVINGRKETETVNVALEIPETDYPVLSVTPDTGASVGPDEAGYTDTVLYTVSNIGTGAMTWSASTNQSWATLDVGSGTLAPGASQVVTVTVDTTGLSAGEHTATLTVSETSGGSQTRDITAEVLGYVAAMSVWEHRGTNEWHGSQEYVDNADQKTRCCAITNWNVTNGACVAGPATGWIANFAAVFQDTRARIDYTWNAGLGKWVAEKRYRYAGLGYYFQITAIGATDADDWEKFYVKFAYDTETIWIQLSTILTYAAWVASGQNAATDYIYFVHEGDGLPRPICGGRNATASDWWRESDDMLTPIACSALVVNAGAFAGTTNNLRDGGVQDRTGSIFKVG